MLGVGDKHVPEIYDVEGLSEKIAKFPPYYERNFMQRFCVGVSKESSYLDTRLSMHSSKSILLFLAEGHSIIKEKKVIKSIDFKVGKEDRLANHVRGKHKKGGQILNKNSVICYLETTDGQKFPVSAGIKAKLFDINRAILDNPMRLVEEYNTTGYLAMLFPENFRDSADNILTGLATKEEYEKILVSRTRETNF